MSAAHRSYPGTDEEGYTEYQEGQDPYGSTEGADRGEDDERAQRSWPREEAEAGPSRKRPREEDHSENGHGQGRGHPPPSNPPLPGGPHHGGGIRPDMPIIPSIFGIAPRNPFTRTVGEFIMNHARGRENVEIEIKLGVLMSMPDPSGQSHRIRLPALSEMIMPTDFQLGPFRADMTKQQNQSLNNLLNSAAQSSLSSPFPVRFSRARQIDSFYDGSGGGKIRVSRDRAGQVIPNGVIRKRRLGDLNITCPGEALDFRVSVNTEDPCDMPRGEPIFSREKDRACYLHQLVEVDLTVVTARPHETAKPTVSFEIEIEVVDVPTLVLEGEKEERGEDNRFDEMLQSCLDTARMLIRNVG
ncbi:mRNA-capping enzyme subunit beta [Saitozyma podzolica]|uniref:mRNA-capping enzyme subunit beta n=1 Tax=Saitozyma podzolica TaxID=1890683 RepID=A0A427YG65_9TREE|nr:mRNA-capping enzyme subunit beta [Saitozyma podzolica]